MLIYVNIAQTDRQTHQKYSSEPHKKFLILKNYLHLPSQVKTKVTSSVHTARD